MDMQWSLIWTHSNAVTAKVRKKHALADPLDGAAWDGLGWTIPLIARLVAGPRLEHNATRKTKPVERFTESVPN